MDSERVQLGHGGGGQLTAELIAEVILPALGVGGMQDPARLTDSAVVALAGGADRVAMTTDGYVVWPLEFAGGDIGKLSVCGTINDLAMAGARPLALTMGLVIEEGFEIDRLRRLLESAGRAAAEAGVGIVAGDTKVVERGGVSGLVINTAGIGMMEPAFELGFDRIADGDRIILSGALGEHGLAVMSQREGLEFEAQLESDCAALNGLTAALAQRVGPGIRFMRDPTRGGLAATLAEISACTGRDLEIEEASIPVNSTARAAAEMLGLDLLTTANEGKLVAVVSADAAAEAVDVLRAFEISARASVIGLVGGESNSPLVEMITSVGGRRIVQMPYGEELPRIC